MNDERSRSVSDDLRYPIGRFVATGRLSPERRRAAIAEIAALPNRLAEAVANLSDEQLDTPYRPDGWSIRQLVHHVADSHVNSYTRFKRAVTEPTPTIRGYDQAAWAELPEARSEAIGISLDLLQALHARWVAFLRRLPEEAWSRELIYPEFGTITLDTLLEMYAWHSNHHVHHVLEARERHGW